MKLSKINISNTYIQDMANKKSIYDIKLLDLFNEDYDVYVNKNNTFGVNLYIEDENGKEFIKEILHPFAAESFASFCRDYLYHYEKAVA